MAKLQFLQNAGLNISQQHTIHFQSLAEQNTFWSSRIVTLSDDDTEYILSRCLEGMPISYGSSKQTLLGINYCRLLQDGKWWYFFIENKKYINDSATNLFLKLDVMQTFLIGIDYTFEESFVEREHQDRLNSQKQRIYNLEQENLNYGSDNETVSNRQILPNISNVPVDTFKKMRLYMILLNFAPSFLTVGQEQSNKVDSQYTSVMVPVMYHPDSTIDINKVKVLHYNGTKYQVPTISQFYSNIVDGASNNDIWSMTLIPYFPSRIALYYDGTDYILEYIPPSAAENIVTITKNNTTYPAFYPLIDINMSSGMPISNESVITGNLPSISDSPRIELESKLYTYPYFYYSLSDSNSEGKVIKNEYVNGNEMTFQYTNNWTGVIKDGMKLSGYKLGSEIDRGFTRLNQMELPQKTSQYAEYLAGNKNSMSAGLAAQGVGAITGLGGSIVAGALTGNPIAVLGGVISGVNSAMGIAQNLAKIQDIKDSPDSVKNVGSTTQMMILSDLVYFRLKTYQITDIFRNKIFSYFMHYGYRVNQYKIPNINTRYYYNYIKTIGSNISANIDNEYITEIKNLLDNGITFWHYRNSSTWKGIENYEYENAEMSIVGGN